MNAIHTYESGGKGNGFVGSRFIETAGKGQVGIHQQVGQTITPAEVVEKEMVGMPAVPMNRDPTHRWRLRTDGGYERMAVPHRWQFRAREGHSFAALCHLSFSVTHLPSTCPPLIYPFATNL